MGAPALWACGPAVWKAPPCARDGVDGEQACSAPLRRAWPGWGERVAEEQRWVQEHQIRSDRSQIPAPLRFTPV